MNWWIALALIVGGVVVGVAGCYGFTLWYFNRDRP